MQDEFLLSVGSISQVPRPLVDPRSFFENPTTALVAHVGSRPVFLAEWSQHPVG
ncbi:hypothetical protein D3C81_2251480 [compost metagenome]